jgi:hypothetical protein
MRQGKSRESSWEGQEYIDMLIYSGTISVRSRPVSDHVYKRSPSKYNDNAFTASKLNLMVESSKFAISSQSSQTRDKAHKLREF